MKFVSFKEKELGQKFDHFKTFNTIYPFDIDRFYVNM